MRTTYHHIAFCAFLLLLLWPCTTQAQNKPVFHGSEQFDHCAVDLPLTYASKDEARYTAAAKGQENVELVYLAVDKKSGEAKYERVFVGVGSAKGKSFVYLETPEDHNAPGPTKTAMFKAYKAKTNGFYRADCFVEVLIADPDLAAHIKEGK